MEEVVLGFLRSGPQHGYELRHQIRQALGPAWKFTSSQIYSWLHTLEQRGYVTSWTEPGQGRRPRRVYALTPQGEARFERWLWEERGPRKRGAFLVRLFFVARFCPHRVGEFVDREAQNLRQRQRRLASRGPYEDVFEEAVRQFRLLQIETGLRWLEEVQKLCARRSRC